MCSTRQFSLSISTFHPSVLIKFQLLTQISIHSPYEVPTDNTQFFSMGLTDEIESTYNMLETMYVEV